MKKVLLLAAYFTLSVANATPFGKFEYNEKVCGGLQYIQGNYVLKADHGDNYSVRESKFDQNDFSLTGNMQIIVMNHDYEESDAPQVCFFGMGSERMGKNELDVLTLEGVERRQSLD